MAFMYEKSRWWRRVVHTTKASNLAMTGFSLVAGVAIPFVLFQATMYATNPGDDEVKNEKLRSIQSLDSQVKARVNKDRLADMFAEIKERSASEERYRFALDQSTLNAWFRESEKK